MAFNLFLFFFFTYLSVLCLYCPERFGINREEKEEYKRVTVCTDKSPQAAQA